MKEHSVHWVSFERKWINPNKLLPSRNTGIHKALTDKLGLFLRGQNVHPRYTVFGNNDSHDITLNNKDLDS